MGIAAPNGQPTIRAVYCPPRPNTFFGPMVPHSTEAVKNVKTLGHVMPFGAFLVQTLGMPFIWKLRTPVQINVDASVATTWAAKV